MSEALEHARMLLMRRRYADARVALGRAIAEDDTLAEAYCLLSLCFAGEDDFPKALAAANQALACDAELPFAHYAQARALASLKRRKDALRAIDEALRLDPEDADYIAARAAILYDLDRWREALEAAEQGLTLDPDNQWCVNLRTMALTKLGQFEEARTTLAGSLQRDAENPLTHTNQGWNYLHLGQHQAAMTHFREALRLDPESDYARHGLIEALKARHFVYRIFLRYILFMSRRQSGMRWAIVIGGYLTMRAFMQSKTTAQPWATLMNVYIVAYVAFAYFSWMAQPLFNLLLFMHPVGRHALSRVQRVQAMVVGGFLGAALACLLAAWRLDSGRMVLVAVVCLVSTIPASITFRGADRRRQWVLGSISLTLLGLGLLGAFTFPRNAACLTCFSYGTLLLSVFTGLGNSEK